MTNETEQETQETAEPSDERGNRLWGLMTVLQGQGFTAEPIALRVSAPERPGVTITVECAPRASDGGRLWFVGPGGEPLAEADHITDAIVRIKHLIPPVQM